MLIMAKQKKNKEILTSPLKNKTYRSQSLDANYKN
jgi:hypothetical protein